MTKRTTNSAINYIAVDTGFPLALYSPRDAYKPAALETMNVYFGQTSRNVMVVPYPILYETLSTQLVKHRSSMEKFHRDWITLKSQGRIQTLSDEAYKNIALEECFNELERRRNYRELSLTDRVIRHMLSDSKVNITHFITFNQKDFVDTCAHQSIIML